MPRTDIGEISCCFHDEKKTAFVRRDKKGKLYIFCPHCGIIAPRLAVFQRHIEQEAVFYDGDIRHGGGVEAVGSKAEISRKSEIERLEDKTSPKSGDKKEETKTAEAKPEIEPQKVKNKSGLGLVSGLMGVLGSEE